MELPDRHAGYRPLALTNLGLDDSRLATRDHYIAAA
jgi:hypothetical protein